MPEPQQIEFPWSVSQDRNPVPPKPRYSTWRNCGETLSYNLVQAGVAVGKSKSAILKAIRRGALSATRDAATGGWQIDPAELHRAFPPVSQETSGDRSETSETGETRELRARLADKDAVIDDLRRRLDQRETDHRQALDRLAAAQERIAALLTDQRPAAPSPARPRWWRWGL